MAVLDTFSLAGKRAVVTGGSRGIGKALTRGLAEAGAAVAIISRDAQVAAHTVEELRAEGHDVSAVTGDLTAGPGLIDAAADALGGLDVLVNNAGACIHKPALEATDDEWDAVFDLNVKALWRSSREAARHLTPGGGTIINVGSMSGYIVNRPQPQAAYNASKAAVHHLTKSLAAEWAPLGIRVNALAPGYVNTEMAPVDRPEFRRYWIEDAPQQRYARPEEMAPATVFLASEASAFMTGSILVIDGGYTVF
ncbi:SDR family NAD(P)-dependent oxidoreductase [Cryptosporangium phraense]|uniref:SDR family oxidoreductase n=1 Tax=Cryptosporangium phraense TaxID=2593070 RepID=A0A545AIL9_9ACTN|nr:SDR family oxidoreductase [Cryptosporangium phraense]TQS41177.1 SDR family oxidoreductase [Cryptosporangium phraense]